MIPEEATADMIVRYVIRVRQGLPDLAGSTAKRRLIDFGLPVGSVASARLFELGLPAAEGLNRVGDRLLADSVSERWELEEPGGPSACLPDTTVLEIRSRPGVMDPVAMTTAAALRECGLRPAFVRTGRRFELRPALDEPARRRAAALLGNDCVDDVFDGIRPLAAPPTPRVAGFDIGRVALRDMDEAALERLSRQGHLFLSRAEMLAIQAEFRRLERDPTDLELETLAQTWSEHCVHKTLKSEVIYRGAAMPSDGDGVIERRYASLLKDTIARVTSELVIAGRGPECLSVFKDNAGVIGFDEHFGIAVKVETHNHPSAIEPYGGAATGLGGCIRDVLGCGLGAQPIANTDVFCVAPPDWPADALPRGVIHPRVVLQGVIAGVRDYGNRMGIPTVNGAVHFDPRFLGNPLVFAGCVGLIPRDRVLKAARPGDHIVLIGGRTGRDGIHGATFSSAELTDTHVDEFAHAVQIGNAIEEKKLVDVVMAAREFDDGGGRRCLFSAITDCGAGGLSSAIGEMAAETGAEVELSEVPLKYAGLRYDEIWISEAQERMVLAVPPDDLERFCAVCRDEDVEATVIGRFTRDGRLVVKYRGTIVGDLAMTFLHDGLPREPRLAEWTPAARRGPDRFAEATNEAGGIRERLLTRLASPNIASKEWLVRRYDHEVQGRTTVKPLVGAGGDGPGDAAVILPRRDSRRGIAIGCGACLRATDSDPYWMAAAAIDEAIRNVVCVGGDPARTAILDNFCWGRTDDPRQFGTMVRACQACHDAATIYGTPFISGKDSLNNEFALHPDDAHHLRAAMNRYGCEARLDSGRLRIPSTLLITAVALIDDVSRCVTMDLKQDHGEVYVIGRQAAAKSGDGGGAFDLRAAATTHAMVAGLIGRGVVSAVHDIDEGGVLTAVAEMVIAGQRSCRIAGRTAMTSHGAAARLSDFYFDESPGRYVVEVRPDRIKEFEALAPTGSFVRIGTSGGADDPVVLEFDGDRPAERIPLAELRRAWESLGRTMGGAAALL